MKFFRLQFQLIPVYLCYVQIINNDQSNALGPYPGIIVVPYHAFHLFFAVCCTNHIYNQLLT